MPARYCSGFQDFTRAMMRFLVTSVDAIMQGFRASHPVFGRSVGSDDYLPAKRVFSAIYRRGQ